MRRNAVLTLLVSFALFAKALIPAGWMPSGGSTFEITVCTGTDTHSLWLDQSGTLHERDPNQKNDDGADSKNCAFAGLSAAADLPDAAAALVPPIRGETAGDTVRLHAAIGRGLAAPPPPATGPPSLS